jgi:hypothetical protein
MHNVAQQVLEDLLMFTWPLAYVVFRILISPGGNRLARLELMIGALGTFSLFLFLGIDGGLVFDLGRAHPFWGTTLLLTVLSTVIAVVLRWRQTQSDNDQLSRGVLDAQIIDVKVAGLRPRIFAGTAAVLAILAIGWLYLISKTATGSLS